MSFPRGLTDLGRHRVLRVLDPLRRLGDVTEALVTQAGRPDLGAAARCYGDDLVPEDPALRLSAIEQELAQLGSARDRRKLTANVIIHLPKADHTFIPKSESRVHPHLFCFPTHRSDRSFSTHFLWRNGRTHTSKRG